MLSKRTRRALRVHGVVPSRGPQLAQAVYSRAHPKGRDPVGVLRVHGMHAKARLRRAPSSTKKHGKPKHGKPKHGKPKHGKPKHGKPKHGVPD